MQRLDQVEVRTATAFTGAHAPTFLVTRSSDAMGHRKKSYETAAFPSLHSNGLATVYDDNRKVGVAPAEAKRHLLSLSLRTFAQHPLWQVVHFDNEEKDRSQGLMTVRLARDSQLAESAVQVTEKKLQAHVAHQLEVQSRSCLEPRFHR